MQELQTAGIFVLNSYILGSMIWPNGKDSNIVPCTGNFEVENTTHCTSTEIGFWVQRVCEENYVGLLVLNLRLDMLLVLLAEE